MKDFFDEVWDFPRNLLAWVVLHLAIWLDVIPSMTYIDEVEKEDDEEK